MKSACKLLLLILFSVILRISGNAQHVDQELDDFFTKYIARINAVRAEPNDDKAITQLKKVKDEILADVPALKNKLEKTLNNLNEKEREAWVAQLLSKPYVKDLMAIGLDQKFMARIDKHPALKKAYEDLQSLTSLYPGTEKESATAAGTSLQFNLSGVTNQTFALKAENITKSSAVFQDGTTQVTLEGFDGNTQISISFYFEGDKPVTYQWVGDYSLTIAIHDGKTERVLGGHEGKGSVKVTKVEAEGGWVSGTFAGKVSEEKNPETLIQLNGSFNVKREKQEE